MVEVGQLTHYLVKITLRTDVWKDLEEGKAFGGDVVIIL